MHMYEKTSIGVSSEKEKVKESQSRSVKPSLDTPSGVGLGRHTTCCNATTCSIVSISVFTILAAPPMLLPPLLNTKEQHLYRI